MNSAISSGDSRFQKIEVGELRVLGEQDGPPERLLKCRVTAILRQYTTISAAYLVRVGFAESVSQSISLCLVSEANANEQIVAEIGEVFAELFTSAVHMDIIFLRPDQEVEVSNCCRAFFRVREK